MVWESFDVVRFDLCPLLRSKDGSLALASCLSIHICIGSPIGRVICGSLTCQSAGGCDHITSRII